MALGRAPRAWPSENAVCVAHTLGTKVDTARLSAALGDITDALGRMDREIEGRFADALTRLRNCREELASHLARARQTAASLAQATEMSLPSGGGSDRPSDEIDASRPMG